MFHRDAFARRTESIGDLFDANSIDEIVSNRLPPNTIGWGRVLPGAQKVLRLGSKIVIRFQSAGGDAEVIAKIWQKVGFKTFDDAVNKGVALTLTK